MASKDKTTDTTARKDHSRGCRRWTLWIPRDSRPGKLEKNIQKRRRRKAYPREMGGELREATNNRQHR